MSTDLGAPNLRDASCSALVLAEQMEYMAFDALNGMRAWFSDGSFFDGR
jgi:hypothetical protein